VSQEQAGGLGLVGWLLWSIIWALVLRTGFSWLFRRFAPTFPDWARPLAIYAVMATVFLLSFFIHGAVLGGGQMYGAAPRQAFSVETYVLAPFGLPLLVGGLLLLIGEALRDVLFAPLTSLFINRFGSNVP
jgi:hypothetical protein